MGVHDFLAGRDGTGSSNGSGRGRENGREHCREDSPEIGRERCNALGGRCIRGPNQRFVPMGATYYNVVEILPGDAVQNDWGRDRERGQEAMA